MKLSPSLIEQIKCRIREFLREPSAFFWVVFMPLLWMVILGFSFSDPKPEIYGVGWLNDSSSKQDLVEQLESHPQITLKKAGKDELTTLIKRGEIQLFIDSSSANIVYHFDDTNPTAIRAKEKVDDIIQRQAGRTDSLLTTSSNLTAKGSRYIDFLVPGLLGLSIMTSSLFGVAMTLVSNRRENLLKRYLATPMKPYEYIVSHIIGRYVVLTTEFAAVMLGGYFIFNFVVAGSMVDFILVTMLGAAAFTAIAMVCGSKTKSIPTVSGITNIISMPMMMLSGVFFSTANFPDWLQTAVKYLPLTALIDALRKIALEARGFESIGFELAILVVYLLVGTVAATRLFRWT